MKIFIWNTEYDVLMAIAPTIEKAKELIIEKNNLNAAEYEKINSGIRHSHASGQRDTPEWIAFLNFSHNEKKAFFSEAHEHRKTLTFVLNQEPDFIFETNEMAYLWSHSNE